jgi:hypothetical protein
VIGWNDSIRPPVAGQLHEWLAGYESDLAAVTKAVLAIAAPLDDWLTADPARARSLEDEALYEAERAALGGELSRLWAVIVAASARLESRLAMLRPPPPPRPALEEGDCAPFTDLRALTEGKDDDG